MNKTYAVSYPIAENPLPPRDEIKEVLDFAEELFEKVCRRLKIDLDVVKK